MAEINVIEKRKLEKLLEMESGYVLDFSDRSMADFFIDAVQANIEDRERYGDASKANRMREFWRIEPEYRVGKLIEALIEYRAFKRGDRPDDDHELVEDCRAIARRLMAGGPIELTDSRVLDPLSHEFIDEQGQKCRRKMAEGDHSGAITNARTLVETVFLALEKELFEGAEDHKGDMKRLYRRVCGALNLEAGRSDLATPLQQIITGLNSIVTGLAAIRSKASDAHGKLYRTHEHHARVAVDAATTLTNFLLSSFEYQHKARGSRSDGRRY